MNIEQVIKTMIYRYHRQRDRGIDPFVLKVTMNLSDKVADALERGYQLKLQHETSSQKNEGNTG